MRPADTAMAMAMALSSFLAVLAMPQGYGYIQRVGGAAFACDRDHDRARVCGWYRRTKPWPQSAMPIVLACLATVLAYNNPQLQ